MNKITLNNQNGFTLIEVLIGITVFAIGILALTIMQVGAVKGNSSAGDLTEASTIGQDRLEALMTLDYLDPALNDTDGDGTAGLNHATAATADSNDTYTGTTNIQYNIFWNIAVDPPTFTDTKAIRVFVIWNENGRLRTVTFDSLKNIDT